MNRFVILFHEMPAESEKPSHWDLMLEEAESLRTWNLFSAPQLDQENVATRIHDHRKKYLEYSGLISNDRGRVSQVDHGVYEIKTESDQVLEVRLSGKRFQGMMKLKLTPDNGLLNA